MDAYNKPPNLSAELVSKAHGYKSRAKLLYKDVLVRILQRLYPQQC